MRLSLQSLKNYFARTRNRLLHFSWKKIVGLFIVALFSLVLFLCLLFCLLVMNPLESPYEKPLLALVPLSTNLCFYIPMPLKFGAKLSDDILWVQLQQSPRWKKFTATPTYKNFYRKLAIDRLQKHFREIRRYLPYVLGKEIVIALQFRKKKLDFLIMTRVAWQAKVIDGLAPFFTPAAIRKRYKLKLGGQIRTTKIPKWHKLYWMRHRDVQLFSSTQESLKEILYSLENASGALVDFSPTFALQVKNIQKFVGDIMVYGNIEELYRRLKYKKSAPRLPVLALLEKYLPIHNMKNCRGEISISSGIELHVTADMKAANKPQLVTHKLSPLNYTLPQGYFAHSNLLVEPENFWNLCEQQIPSFWQPRLRKYLKKIDRQQKTPDFIGQCFGEYLQHQVVVLISKIDFSRQTLMPLDLYPGTAILCKSLRPQQFFHRIATAMQQLAEQMNSQNIRMANANDFAFFTKKQYAGRALLLFKYLDPTGGAIQPAMGIVGDFLVLTTHVSLLKEMIDIEDQIRKPAKKKEFDEQMQQLVGNNHTLDFFIDGDEGLQALENIKQQFIDWVIWQSPYSKKLKKSPKRQKHFQQAFAELLQHIKIVRFACSLACNLTKDKTQISIRLPVAIRRN